MFAVPLRLTAIVDPAAVGTECLDINEGNGEEAATVGEHKMKRPRAQKAAEILAT
jgi:hypothetical protein